MTDRYAIRTASLSLDNWGSPCSGANRPPEREARRGPKSAAFGRSVLSAGLGLFFEQRTVVVGNVVPWALHDAI